MQTLTQPSVLLKPFAEQGDKNTIPDVNTDQSEPQRADFTSGFPAIVSLPADQGGLPPERKDFNALGYLTTLYDFFYQAGGTFTFDPTTSTAIGGYPLGARLWYTNSNGVSMILRSTIQNNTNNFLTDSSVVGQPGENKPWVIENFMGIVSQMPLFSFNWFDHEPNDGSWLNADDWSWNDGTIYTSAYEMLVDQYTNGIQGSETIGSYTIQYTTGTNGMKIVTAANAGTVQDIYLESGVAWYYILDTTNTQFKLPRTKYGFVGLRDTVEKYVPESLPNIKGQANQDGINDNTTNGLVAWGTNSGPFYAGSTNPTTAKYTAASGSKVTAKLGFDASRVSSTYQDDAPVQQRATQMRLYFFVGNTIRNVTEIDAGQITETLSHKWDSSNMQVVSSLPANPQTGVFYFIK